MNTPTPSIPGVDRDALVEAINRDAPFISTWTAGSAADVAIAHIAAHHECALPATWDDDGSRPVEGEHGWVTPLLPDGSQRFPDGTPVEMWSGRYADRARFLFYVARDKYAPMLGGTALSWHKDALIRPVLPPVACDRDHDDEFVFTY